MVKKGLRGWKLCAMSGREEETRRREVLEGLSRAELIGTIVTLEERLDRATAFVEKQERLIEDQQRRLEIQDRQIEQQRRQIAQQAVQIEKQALQIEEQRQCIEVQNGRIVQLEGEISRLNAEVSRLEAEVSRLKKGPPTSRNSHLPPSKDLTAGPSSAAGKAGKDQRRRKQAHTQGGRMLAASPDEVKDVFVDACPYCLAVVTRDLQQVKHAYDHVDIPPIAAITTRVNLHGCDCPACGKTLKAAPPQDMPPASPFGPNLMLLALCLRFEHGVSFARLSRFMGEFVGVPISRGALCNLLHRAGEKLLETARAIHDVVRRQPYLQSDETTLNVGGDNYWEWVFVSKTAVAHVVKRSRGYQVIEDFLAGSEPVGWGSDRLPAQRKAPARVWQACLAHLIRDCNKAHDAGDFTFAPKLRTALGKITALYHQRDDLTPRQFANRRTRLRKRISALFDRTHCTPWQQDGHDLQRKLAPIHHCLSTCLDHPQLQPTNNACEQAIRMSKVFIKIWGCLRTEKGAEHFAAIRTILATARLHHLTPKEALSLALNRQFPLPA